MAVQARSLTEITHAAMELLTREMGVADTMRFLNQFGLGQGDYTLERRELFDYLPLDEIVDEIQRGKKAP